MSASIVFTTLLSCGGGLAAGILSGLFGVGGGTLVVPMLMLLGAGIHQAVGLSLVYIFFTSLSGSLAFRRQGLLDLAPVLVMSASSSLSIYFGIHLSLGMSPRQVAWLFAGFMVVVLSMFVLRKHMKPKVSPAVDPVAEAGLIAEVQTGRLDPASLPESKPALTPARWAAIAGTGMVAGMLASLLGVGGGLIMVPLLVLLAGFDLKRATGNSLASVCLISAIGLGQHILFGELLPALSQFALALGLMSIAGMCAAPMGVRLNQRLPEAWLQTGFISLCLGVMAYMSWQGLHAR